MASSCRLISLDLVQFLSSQSDRLSTRSDSINEARHGPTKPCRWAIRVFAAFRARSLRMRFSSLIEALISYVLHAKGELYRDCAISSKWQLMKRLNWWHSSQRLDQISDVCSEETLIECRSRLNPISITLVRRTKCPSLVLHSLRTIMFVYSPRCPRPATGQSILPFVLASWS